MSPVTEVSPKWLYRNENCLESTSQICTCAPWKPEAKHSTQHSNGPVLSLRTSGLVGARTEHWTRAVQAALLASRRHALIPMGPPSPKAVSSIATMHQAHQRASTDERGKLLLSSSSTLWSSKATWSQGRLSRPNICWIRTVPVMYIVTRQQQRRRQPRLKGITAGIRPTERCW